MTRDLTDRESIAIACVVLLVAAIAATCSGCGASAIAQHGAAIRVVATTYDVAANTAEGALTAELQACTDVPCVDEVERRWAPVATASAAVLVAMQAWVSTLDLVRAAGEDGAPGVLWHAALRAFEDVARAWVTLVEAARGQGVDLPALPAEVLALASAMGGE